LLTLIKNNTTFMNDFNLKAVLFLIKTDITIKGAKKKKKKTKRIAISVFQ